MKAPKVGDYSTKTQYIGFPEHLFGVRTTCRYELSFKDTEVVTPENGAEFLVVRFICGANDAGISEGTELSTGLHATGQFAATYFWQNMFGIYCALKGVPYTAEQHEKLKPNAAKVFGLFTSGKLAKKYGGANVVCTLTRRPNKRDAGKMTVDTVWSSNE
jgi:hypothetical protein